MKKVQAEPDPDTGAAARWIVNGLTVLNNKGKPVKQYEPYFSVRFGCEAPAGRRRHAGHVLRRRRPPGSHRASRRHAEPRRVLAVARGDVRPERHRARERRGMRRRPSIRPRGRCRPTSPGGHRGPRAARRWLAARHADTPSLRLLDGLGREAIVIADDRVGGPRARTPSRPAPWADAYLVHLSAARPHGQPLSVRDARGNLGDPAVIPARRARPRPRREPALQRRMDAGERWTVTDAAGAPMSAWDVTERSQPGGRSTSGGCRTWTTTTPPPDRRWLRVCARRALARRSSPSPAEGRAVRVPGRARR